MKKVILVALFLLVTTTALAGEKWIIKPRQYDLNPGDGFMEEGSYSNPYEIRDRYGRRHAIIKPRQYDLRPGDGFMEQGSQSNPYEIEWED